MKKLFYTGAIAIMLSPIIAFAGTAVPAGQSEFNTSAASETPPSYVLLTPLPAVGVTCGTNAAASCTTVNGAPEITSIGIQGYLVYIFKLLIGLAVFLAVVMTIFGGFKYMSVESVTGKSDAKETIKNAVGGLLLALASYLILYTINPNLVNLSKVAVPKLNVAASSAVQDSINNLNRQQYITNRATINSAIDTNAAAAATAQAAQQDMNTLAGQLYTDGCVDGNGNDISNGDPNCAAMENQYINDQNIVNTAVATQNTQTAIATMAHAENAINIQHNVLLNGTNVAEGNTSFSDAQTAIQTINNTFNNAWPSIPNGDVADKQAITDQMTYQEASVVNTYKTNIAIADIVSSEQMYNNATDAVTTANALIQTLKTNSIPNQTNSNGLITNPIGTLSPTSTLGIQYANDNKARITALQNAIRAVGGTPVQ